MNKVARNRGVVGEAHNQRGVLEKEIVDVIHGFAGSRWHQIDACMFLIPLEHLLTEGRGRLSASNHYT